MSHKNKEKIFFFTIVRARMKSVVVKINKKEVIIMKKLMSLILASAFVLALTGCETTKGVGKDIQHAGEKVEQVVTK